MAKVITFSTTFPAYHPKKGQRTFFELNFEYALKYPLGTHSPMLYPGTENQHLLKFHTIRAGNRFKKGEYFSPRVWTGKPYNSKQRIIAPDTKIEKIWDIDIYFEPNNWLYAGKKADYGNVKYDIEKLAKNDGLEYQDFVDWFIFSPDFKKTNRFSGQIICWNNNINY